MHIASSRSLLAGVRVLELGHIVAGPSASLVLAELGGDVIKVERPGSGDQARFSRGNQGYFLAFNGGKRSMTIDLKSARGAEVFTRLLKTADVVLDNYGPHGSMSGISVAGLYPKPFGLMRGQPLQ